LTGCRCRSGVGRDVSCLSSSTHSQGHAGLCAAAATG